MKTVNDLIMELSSLQPKLRNLPVKIVAENGLLFEPEIKLGFPDSGVPFDDTDKIILTW